MSNYFSHNELKCKCGCDQAPMNQEFMDKLNYLRAAYNKPMIVSSGYRCPNHPIEAKKAKTGSHASGKAIDIAVSGADALKLLYFALEFGFTGIGIQQKGESRFIHLDICTADDGFTRPTIWSY